MDSLNLACEALGATAPPKVESLGPRGGNLLDPARHPEQRQAGLNSVSVEGIPTLHRFVREDVARTGVANEQPWHRMAAYMMLSGFDNARIAEVAHKSEETVKGLKSQRWFQELLALLAAENGEDLMGLVKAEAAASLMTIVELRDNEELPARVRLSAATTLWEQANGKPTQRVISSVTHRTLSPQEELAELDSQIAALQQPST